MNTLKRVMPWERTERAQTEPLITREWLVTNGLGGYASGSVSGVITRRYHGYLIAALAAPFGRTVMLNHISEQLRLFGEPEFAGQEIYIGVEEQSPDNMMVHTAKYLDEFRLEMGLPVWKYRIGKFVLEKSVLLPHWQNTVHVTYKLIDGPGHAELSIRPSLHFRMHEHAVDEKLEAPYEISIKGNRYEIRSEGDLPPLRMVVIGESVSLTMEGTVTRELNYTGEAERGYASRGVLWTPGHFKCPLWPGQEVTLVGSTEPWLVIFALNPKEARESEKQRRLRLLSLADERVQKGTAAELVLAADQFIITPAGRRQDSARASAAGDEIRTIIAGYHWFTDWGRDTMISLEGLTLCTGRINEAGWILRTFAYYVKNGLIPNLFPEHEREGRYNTADASLWYFHAVDRYLAYRHDIGTLQVLLPKLMEIIEFHMHGTQFGIRMDPKDALLSQGQEGLQLTWMDAKVGDWVVTPRRGKAVEINALWYNALRLMEKWAGEKYGQDKAKVYGDTAEKVRESFNKRFWYAGGKYLYDVVDGEKGDDAAFRPNQVIAISLPNTVLDVKHWADVMHMVEEKLLTPVGLRSLSPGNADYKPKYFGDLRARDAAYHQGTVWAWLIGPYLDAYLKMHPDDKAGARKKLEGFTMALDEACIGSISEIFDAEAPYTPRGCIAQAWSIAEVLRCWVKTAT